MSQKFEKKKPFYICIKRYKKLKKKTQLLMAEKIIKNILFAIIKSNTLTILVYDTTWSLNKKKICLKCKTNSQAS